MLGLLVTDFLEHLTKAVTHLWDAVMTTAGVGGWQAVWVWTVTLPVTIVNGSSHNPGVRAVDIVGWILWLVGLVIEAIADQQKLNFKKSPGSKGKWCDVGVWKWSRHPNYFGEVNNSCIFVASYSSQS
jgi:steroid 5-alpha reductase family enzyme